MKRFVAVILALAMTFACSAALASENVLIGDCNGDGSVSSADASMILRYLVGMANSSEHMSLVADTDGNGTINANDASLILRCLIGLAKVSGTVEVTVYADELVLPESATLYVGNQLTLELCYSPDNADVSFSAAVENESIATAAITNGSVTINGVSIGETILHVSETVSGLGGDITINVVDIPANETELYAQIVLGLYGTAYGELTSSEVKTADAVYAFVTSLNPDDPYTEVILAGIALCGTSYDDLDCSNFTRQAYRDCGYGSKYICAGSENQIQLFRKRDVLYEIEFSSGNVVYDKIRSGYVLLWVSDEGVGNHSAIYLGKINGKHYLLESSSSKGGVGINVNWNSYGSWKLKYYADVLGTAG